MTVYRDKTPQMKKFLSDLSIALFGNDPLTGVCAVCGREIDTVEFRDDLSRREYEVSGLCQRCQDDLWGPEISEGALEEEEEA